MKMNEGALESMPLSVRKAGRFRRLEDSGQALAEMAIVLPFLLVLFVGVIDFCRIFYTSMMLTQAARAGVQYGGQSKAKSQQFAEMQQVAIDTASDLTPVIAANATRYCECPSGGQVDCSTNCGVDGAPRVYVTVTTGYTFNTFFPYPGIPTNIALSRTAVMLVP
jgi:Flp pilus assembly protein TadG